MRLLVSVTPLACVTLYLSADRRVGTSLQKLVDQELFFLGQVCVWHRTTSYGLLTLEIIFVAWPFQLEVRAAKDSSPVFRDCALQSSTGAFLVVIFFKVLFPPLACIKIRFIFIVEAYYT